MKPEKINIHEYIHNLFIGENASAGEITVNNNGDSDVVTFVDVAAEDREYVQRCFEALGFVPTYSGRETASTGTLEFTNEPSMVEMATDFLYSEDTNGDLPEDDSDAEDTTTVVEKAEIDGGGRALKILCNPENKKMADKIYQGLLGNNEDYSTYADFLYGFDNFLKAHRPELEDEAQQEMEGGDEEDDEGEEAPVVKKKSSNLGNIKSLKEGNNGETASVALITPMEIAAFALEVAKDKSARSVVLSALMKGMSSSAGISAIEAWEKGDPEALGEAFGNVISGVMESMPMDESDEDSDEEDTGDDESSSDDAEDGNEDDADGGDDAGDDESDSDDSSDEDDSSDDSDTSDADDNADDADDSTDEKKTSKSKEPKAVDDKKSKESPRPGSKSKPDHEDNTPAINTGFVGVEDLDASKKQS